MRIFYLFSCFLAFQQNWKNLISNANYSCYSMIKHRDHFTYLIHTSLIKISEIFWAWNVLTFVFFYFFYFFYVIRDRLQIFAPIRYTLFAPIQHQIRAKIFFHTKKFVPTILKFVVRYIQFVRSHFQFASIRTHVKWIRSNVFSIRSNVFIIRSTRQIRSNS